LLRDLLEEALQHYGKRKDEIFRAMEHEITLISGVFEFAIQQPWYCSRLGI
jgi:hypothetical protein